MTARVFADEKVLANWCRVRQVGAMVRLEEHSHLILKTTKQHCRLPASILIFAFILVTCSVPAAISTESPIGFFTNVASRLLRSELQVELNRIPVYPTNGYTPAVHRLLQVTANLYDSTRTNWYPTIFRPRFALDGTNVFIGGYEEVDATNELALTLPMDVSDAAVRESLATNGCVNIYGIPWILGAKKGLPNFNELAATSLFTVTRRLQVIRPTLDSFPSTWLYEQQLLMELSSEIGVELWNSCAENFTRPVEILASGSVSVLVTNNLGLRLTNGWSLNTMRVINDWPGAGAWGLESIAFIVPLRTNCLIIPRQVYNQVQNTLLPGNTTQFEPLTLAPAQWTMLSDSRVRVVIREQGTHRVLDYVQLVGPSTARMLSEEIQVPASGYRDFWNTNLVALAIPSMSLGVNQQLQVSKGNFPGSDLRAYGNQPSSYEIEKFRDFMYRRTAILAMQAPFSPTIQLAQTVSWQANDPLVHYQAPDLADRSSSSLTRIKPPGGVTNLLPNLGKLNNRYEPWNGNPLMGSEYPGAHDFRIKDPGVRSNDDWDFPCGEPLSVSALGRIHRGTPWQTLYLKATNVLDSPSGRSTWTTWTGMGNSNSAALISPGTDWKLIESLVPLLSTTDVRRLRSINGNVADWRATLDGMVVISNATSVMEFTLCSNTPQLAIVAEAITRNRAAQPGGYFRTITDVLSTPELSTASPWLNLSCDRCISSDEVLELLPRQLLNVLRADSVALASITNGGLALSFTGYDGYPYAIESSVDLNHWTAVTTNTPDGGAFKVLIPPSASEAVFFRSVLLP